MQDAYRIGLGRQAIYPRLGRYEERSARLSVRIFLGFVTFRLFGQPGSGLHSKENEITHTTRPVGIVSNSQDRPTNFGPSGNPSSGCPPR